MAKSATGRLPLADDSSSRRWAVKERTRGHEGGLGGLGSTAVTCHRDERDNPTLASSRRSEVTEVNEAKHLHTGATAGE